MKINLQTKQKRSKLSSIRFRGRNTGGAAMNAMINTEVAVSKVGIKLKAYKPINE